MDGWWDGCKGRDGMTDCIFCSYSCGGTVIISPLLLNSVILSYISRARGREILQFINRSSLCKGDYCMAYTLTSLFSLKDFFSSGFTVLPRLCQGSVMPYPTLSGAQLQHTRVTCSVFAYHHAFVLDCSHGQQDKER